jgi:hypothetical protein
MPTPTTFAELVYMVGDLLNVSVRLIYAGIFVYLVWKLFDSWILHADDERKREEGKQAAIVSVVVLVVLTLVWGIVNLIKASLFGG